MLQYIRRHPGCSVKETPATCCPPGLMWHAINGIEIYHVSLIPTSQTPYIPSLGSRRLGTSEKILCNSQGPRESSFTKKKNRRASIRLGKVGKWYWQVERWKVTTLVIF